MKGEKLKRIASRAIVVMLLLSLFAFVLKIQPTRATGTIYIRADGSIDPPSAKIKAVDNVTYTFTDNIYEGIVVERDNIVVDGEGYTVQGTGNGTGIYLSGRNNVTIVNMKIRAFQNGIRLDDSSNNTISDNNVTQNEYGIGLYESSSFNTLRHNFASGNRYNLGVFTQLVSGYIQDIDDSNTVNGKPVYYWVNRCDMTVPRDAGYVVLVNCTRITARNLNLTNNMQGIAMALTTNSIITENNLINNFDGIRLDHSSNNNMISRNNITANTHYGVRFYYDPSTFSMSKNDVSDTEYGANHLDGPPSNNIISGNYITNNEDGIRIDHSSNNTISDNNVANNGYGIGVYDSSGSNTIFRNNITANDNYGIWLYDSSSSNTISRNKISNNGFGIWLFDSYGCWFHHNIFIGNSRQVYSNLYYCSSTWDDGYPSGGNYWSDYRGSDSYRGLYQNITGSDGIGDTPYIINVNNRDHYPLMYPYDTAQRYTLTMVAATDGTTDPSSGPHSYIANSQVQVTAIPNSGYSFDHWELDSVDTGSTNPYTVLMDKDHSLVAIFTPIPPQVGGLSSPIKEYAAINPITLYLTTTAILAIALAITKRKAIRKAKPT